MRRNHVRNDHPSVVRGRARPGLREVVLVGPKGQIVCERCYLADRVLPRVRGLIGRQRLDVGEGMLLRPTWSIHTAFVRFPIDAVFLDKELTVLAVESGMKPWRVAWKRRAHAVLELAAGQCERLSVRPGDRLAWGRI
jgi:uncharacterized membrane protein (UPF0127 family)